ncbi:hypothetical protein Cni_G12534 [Canna indica]|uniref:Uncharacterized protein n=1 Tax=Canna indica TaxID=4628 RepID=A0AAQ3K9J6_9LILI|nr:hypothetical protein Cni_G12534 [Canna indica]
MSSSLAAGGVGGGGGAIWLQRIPMVASVTPQYEGIERRMRCGDDESERRDRVFATAFHPFDDASYRFRGVRPPDSQLIPLAVAFFWLCPVCSGRVRTGRFCSEFAIDSSRILQRRSFVNSFGRQGSSRSCIWVVSFYLMGCEPQPIYVLVQQ